MTTPTVSTKGPDRAAGATPAKNGDSFWFLSFLLLFVAIAMFSVLYFYLALFEDPGVIPGISLTDRSWGADFIILAVAVFLILLFLSCLPLFLVMRYKRIEYGKLVDKLRLDLGLCGFEKEQVQENVADFRAKNSWSAYFYPTLIMTLYLYLMFGTILLSHGVYGIVVSFSGEQCIKYEQRCEVWVTGNCVKYVDTAKCSVGMVNVPQFLFNLPRTAAPISWAFLGAYFYAISVLFRRWQRSDLTAGTLWKLTARFAVVFILGLLLTKIAPINGEFIVPSLAVRGTERGLALYSIKDNSAVLIALIAFMIGIVPDGFLSRIFLRVRKFFQLGKNPFKPSDLQEKINGLNFWQEDRLMEEGIESVEDLALTDITDLLVKIRFDTPHLLYWVDQALLCHQAGDDFELLSKAHILSATDLLYLAGQQEDSPNLCGPISTLKLLRILRSLGDTSWKKLEVLTNIVDGLRNTPNVPYVWAYMHYTRNLERRTKRLRELGSGESKELSSQSVDDEDKMLIAELLEDVNLYLSSVGRHDRVTISTLPGQSDKDGHAV